MPVNIETAESLEWREKGRDRKVGLNCEQGKFLMLLYMELLESERIGYKEYAHLARNPIIVLRTIHTRQGMTVRGAEAQSTTLVFSLLSYLYIIVLVCGFGGCVICGFLP